MKKKQDYAIKMAEAHGGFCSNTSTHYYPASQQFSKTVYIFACVLGAMISVSSTIGNIVILCALRKCQSLHSPSKALLCSLALTDLVVGLVVLPLFIAYYLTIILEISAYYCAIAVIYGRISSFVVAVSLSTITTIAIDRYLAFHLRLKYRENVTFGRVVGVLVIEWILAFLWTGSWFLSAKVNIFTGAIVLLSCCLITSLCYLSIHCGLRRHIAQIHPQGNISEAGDFNMLQYKKTVASMLWIYVIFLLCFIPTFLSMLMILALGPNNFNRFALHYAATVIYFNSSFNPFIYCWRIKELKENAITNLRILYHFYCYIRGTTIAT